MTYSLIIGDRTYSSWSLRGWLLLEKFGLPYRLAHVTFGDSNDGWEAIDALPYSKTVPTLVTPDGAVVSDSMAIAEELASRHPDSDLWPRDSKARAVARTMTAEMHSSFAALREDCPMNLRKSYSDFAPSDSVKKDVARIEEIWAYAFDTFQSPWLCGDYSIVDAFYAPVAARFAGYGIRLSDRAQAYVDQQLAEVAFRQWRAMALVKGNTLAWYVKENQERDWPGPAPKSATNAAGPSVNEACPYSGKPVTHFLTMNGATYGFCNAFCRDKTVADPEAWPAFMAITA